MFIEGILGVAHDEHDLPRIQLGEWRCIRVCKTDLLGKDHMLVTPMALRILFRERHRAKGRVIRSVRTDFPNGLIVREKEMVAGGSAQVHLSREDGVYRMTHAVGRIIVVVVHTYDNLSAGVLVEPIPLRTNRTFRFAANIANIEFCLK